MSDSLEKAAEALRSRLANAEGVDATFQFEIDGLGALVVDATQSPPTVTTGAGEADLTVGAEEEVFREMMAGDLDPTQAYMGGRLRIDGDMGLAMKLAQILA